ncbi:MAG: signal peptidase I [Acidobacteria bacterium]|nr:signal peptidase I [Acidobacteriota bacterium]
MSAATVELGPIPKGRGELARRIVRDVVLVVGVLATIALALLVAVVHIQFLRVASPSMAPTIDVGDIVVVRPESALQLQPGQVVVLPVPDRGDTMYVHRLTSVDRRGDQVIVTTKGDANEAADPWELRIDSASVPLVVAHVPMPGILAGIGGVGLTRILVVMLLVLLATPMLVMLMSRRRAGSRLRALRVRSGDRRRR